ncbi:DUF7139 domain-containing protein [Halegenticoccus tardaugens]|uniref:DUF7139 domain-containing protein n=1 Tax=Halegenticoccus tardaugens TaxID=2071624 RepID=UPI00100BFF5E|nr:hypothetical protein [Halegenticoccus tardaugens]
MTSLGDVYGGRAGRGTDLRRLYLGVGLFSGGSLLVVAGIVVATVIPEWLTGGDLFVARKYGGMLAGVGVPAVLLGVFAALPAGRTTRAAAVIGASVSAMGLALFSHAYPYRWTGATIPEGSMDLTLPTAGVYFLGIIAVLWCLLVGVANFKTRNDPAGTVTMEVTRRGETRVVEVDSDRRGLGGVGLLGEVPDGDVETRTDRTGGQRSGPTTAPRGASATVGDGGGSASSDIRSPLDDPAPGVRGGAAGSSLPDDDAEVIPNGPSTPAPTRGDTYCGSCDHFRYVRTDEGMEPYCGLRKELMGDMDACEEWRPRY